MVQEAEGLSVFALEGTLVLVRMVLDGGILGPGSRTVAGRWGTLDHLNERRMIRRPHGAPDRGPFQERVLVRPTRPSVEVVQDHLAYR